MSAIAVSNVPQPHISDASLRVLPEECESQLLTRAKAGDVAVFLELVQPHIKCLRALSYSILQNHTDVEDVEQETLLKALCHLHQVRNGASFGGWLLRIGANEARKLLRHRRLSTPMDSDDLPSQNAKQLPKELADSRELPSMRLERNELWRAIGRVLSSLDTIYRDVLLLRDVQQLSVAQTALVLEISEACVKTRLHRARVRMREQLTPAFYAPKNMWVSVQQTLNGTRKPMRSFILNHNAISHLPKYIEGELNRCEIAEIEKTLRLSRTPKVLIDTTHKVVYLLADDRVLIPPFDHDENWDELLSSLPAAA